MNLEGRILEVPIGDIIPNRFQPRLEFDERGLEELANSIKQHGIIQPLVLRRIQDKYEIVAGERRYKAAIKAGLSTVPAVIANIDDNKSAEVAIVENVQRRDLSPIEEARSYKNLLDKGYLTQSELAKKMGISQSAIANKLRLLNLDESVQQALINNEISERHARSLLILESHAEQREWLNRIISKRMTVRELDEALKMSVAPQKEEPTEPDIPLVTALDIDTIRNQARELPKINEQSDIARKLQEIEREKMYNPDVIPVEEATNNSKGNFFNFLENETVNMNTEENRLETPTINLNVTNTPPKEEQAPVIDLTPKAPVDPEDENFDPLSLIDTLDPNYEQIEAEKEGLDLKSAINEIRNTKDNLSIKGFNIALEETDLPDAYQFIIKVKKN